MAAKRSDWIADLRSRHRPGTILTLLQLRELGPGLYTTATLTGLLGVKSESINKGLSVLTEEGLLRYEYWSHVGRLIWWIADWNDQQPDPATQFPRWILRANAATEVEVLLGQQREAAKRIGVSYKSLGNFLNGRYGDSRLQGRWTVKTTPIEYIQQ